MLKLYDTMTRTLRPFQPQHEDHVSIYVCGPTVYDRIHLGNARSAVAFDVIRRYLEYLGYNVVYATNLTDIDDKIVKRAQKEGVSPYVIAERYIRDYQNDMLALNVKDAIQPRVTEYVGAIIDFVQELIEKGAAYQTEDGVYFRVDSDPNYGRLARKETGQLLAGASGRTQEMDKDNPYDFALWKLTEDGWRSPWGIGRPGWHIECSTMVDQLFGATVDIHGGGADLEFPHHTNECAQSHAKNGKPLANYWLHNGFVNVDGDKMSKSEDNFVTADQLIQEYGADVVRHMLASHHYRKPIDYSDKAMSDAKTNLDYLRGALELPTVYDHDSQLDVWLQRFRQAMDDDVNAANGITVATQMAKWLYRGNSTEDAKEHFRRILDVFGVIFPTQAPLTTEQAKLIRDRDAARQAKDWALADAIRQELASQGIILKDTPNGTTWSRN